MTPANSNGREILEQTCAWGYKNHNEQYALNGVCRNCKTKFILKIPKGHEKPTTFQGWDCTNCGCSTVVAE